ncbi:MAG: DUF2283 domain-containing protein [Candidatus Lustribacter sp.]
MDTYPDERMIYVELVEGADASAESEEVSTGVVVDYDDAGQAIGIEIDVDAILTLPALHKA